MPTGDAIGRIRRQADRLRTLDVVDARSPAFGRWFRETAAALDEIFGAGKGPAKEFQLAIFHPLNPSKYDPDSDWRQAYERGVPIAHSFFDSVIRDLGRSAPASAAEPASAPAPEPERSEPSAARPEVLVLCGGEEALGLELAAWLEEAGARPTTRGEPAAGESPLRALEPASPAFALVVLAPAARAAGSSRSKAPKPSTGLRPSPARMFELGFLLGRLGPRRVGALLPPGVEQPFPLGAAPVVRLDASGRWKKELAGALDAAGVSLGPG